MEAGLIGFSGSGVSTQFDAVLGAGGAATGLSGGRGRLATIPVPDPRLARLSALCNPKKTTPAGVRLRDIPGLPRGGGNTANQLASAREVDCLVGVLGVFTADDPAATAAAEREALRGELHLADLQLLEGRLDRKRKAATKPTPTRDADRAEAEALEGVVARMGDGTPLRDIELPALVRAALAEQGAATLKPMLWVANCAEGQLGGTGPDGVLRVCATLEIEAAQLEPADRAELLAAYGVTELAGPRLLRAIYEALGCLSFFTIGEDECRAWTLRRGQTALDAAGVIHTDLARGFVRAKVCTYADVDATGGQDEVRRAGKVRTEGKDYVVADGDVIEVLHSG